MRTNLKNLGAGMLFKYNGIDYVVEVRRTGVVIVKDILSSLSAKLHPDTTVEVISEDVIPEYGEQCEEYD